MIYLGRNPIGLNHVFVQEETNTRAAAQPEEQNTENDQPETDENEQSR